MQAKKLYSYAVIRLVPRVEREEFMNIGVILFCKEDHFLQSRIHINEEKLACFNRKALEDIDQIKLHLDSFELICKGDPAAGLLGQLSLSERFRWLTAVRSTIIQTSPAHPGFCCDPATTLQLLFDNLVK